MRLSSSIKALLPDAKIVLGGPNAGPIGDELLAEHPHIDFIVDDTNGEVPFAKLLEELTKNGTGDLGRVPSLVFRKDGEIARNESDGYEFDINLLNGVYDQYPPDQNLKSWYYGRVVYETQRGCPYKCSFCFYSEGTSTFKDDDAVIDELSRMLKSGLNVELADATFTTRMGRAKKILRALASEPYTGSLYMQAYPSSLDEEMVGLLAKNRIEWLAIGLQTISAGGLEATRRRLNKTNFERAVELLLEHEIPFWVDLIYGLPGTNVEDFLATLDYVISLGVKVITPNRLLGLPGTHMLKDPESGLVFGPLAALRAAQERHPQHPRRDLLRPALPAAFRRQAHGRVGRQHPLQAHPGRRLAPRVPEPALRAVQGRRIDEAGGRDGVDDPSALMVALR